ncbi:hypothetical protein IFR04_008905 [Cadophora malorum]|uniref:Uncharacterized protein n=1 Tax=Cadophora malorum TaxID=108018 RepID=A0A8H7TFN6_9HELO|nr:hypothetical protein IFR04_008905 [Cadophora malorum]
MSKPVAIVTGAASGIGLALTKDLLNQGYRVAMADVNKAEGIRLSAELGEDTLFVPTNIAIYAEQSALFARAFEWGGNRLDFFAANAGIDDRQIIYEKDEKTDENGIPLEFNLTTLRVNFDSAVQGVWLFKFFARKNKVPGGKVVITSSTAGL